MLFTPGPTEMSEEIMQLGGTPLPYFRGPEYCDHIARLTENLGYLFGTATTPLTITASGTAGMEMAIVNLFNPGDKVVSINAGTFGAKWGAMARDLGLDVVEIVVTHGADPDLARIRAAVGQGAKGILLTAHETSTGYLFDIEAICAALADTPCLTVVDGVSAIGADAFRMDAWGCDCAIASSQKALACMPGLVFVAFSARAKQRVWETRHYRSYLDARTYFDNIGRGMLPFTPAMHATYQVGRVLEKIRATGLERHLADIAEKARRFRDNILSHPGYGLFPRRASNALSTVTLPPGVGARALVSVMKEKHGAILPLNPTGAENFVRVSHMGALEHADLARLTDWMVEEAAALARGA